MINGKWLNSLLVMVVALITPILIWFLLHTMALSKTQSFDPNPQVQQLVEQPQNIYRDGSLAQSGGIKSTTWVNLVGKDGNWFVKQKDNSLMPIESWRPHGSRIVLLLEAQGPTLALHLHRYLKEKELSKKVFILSASDGLLKDLRFHDPNLTMSCGQAYIIRFHALHRLNLEGLMTINMSAIYLDPKLFSEEIQELTDFFVAHRVAVFIGPIATAQLPTFDAVKNKANILLE